MADLNSFAELIRKGKEEQRIKEEREQMRKINDNTPLLSELFKTVSTAKRIEEKRQAVVAKVDALEANQVTQEDITELVTEKLGQVSSDAEKKLAAVVKKLQDDIVNLKRHVDSKPSYGIATAGSGEVRVLRMDDVDVANLNRDAILSYDASKKKLSFYQVYDKVFSNVINKHTIINEDMTYTVSSYLKIKDTLHVKGNLGIH